MAKLNGTLKGAKTGNDINVNGFWNGKTYKSQYEGGVVIYVDNAKKNVTQESLDALLANDTKQAKNTAREAVKYNLAKLMEACETDAELYKELFQVASMLETELVRNTKTRDSKATKAMDAVKGLAYKVMTLWK